LAKLLKVSRVIVPMGAGVISALGFLVAPPAVDDVRGYVARLGDVDWNHVNGLFDEMAQRARALLERAGGAGGVVEIRHAADLRYAGQGFEVTAEIPAAKLNAGHAEAIRQAFFAAYAERFGRGALDVPVEVVNWRLSAALPSQHISLARTVTGEPFQRGVRDVEAKVVDRYALTPGDVIEGAAVFEERESSYAVGPDARTEVDAHFNLITTIHAKAADGEARRASLSA
jgi:N-methylhydantoinase A